MLFRSVDDLRSSYGYLQSAAVRVGRQVGAGEVLGRTGTQLHLGLRRGDRYLDPAPLLGRPVGRPRLVPSDRTTRRPSRPRPIVGWRCPAPVGATRSPR